MKIDMVDQKILQVLLEDSRVSIRELAKRVHLSAPSVAERVKRMESEGVIQKYSVQVDYKKLGYEIECFVEVSLRNGEYERFKKFIESYTYAEYCHRIMGKSCYLVKLRIKKLSEIETFINSISTFAITATNIVLSSVETKADFLEVNNITEEVNDTY